MQQLVRVQRCNDDGTAMVIRLCLEDCRSCAGCKKAQLRKVKNSINAACGQVVQLSTSIWFQALVRVSYLLPILLLFAGLRYCAILGGLIGFLLGLVLALWISTKEINAYTISGLSERPTEKGDNDLD